VKYTVRELRLARLLASQAAVAIENLRLRSQVENLLEGFVRASVSAIDLRDPATAGHSLRIASLVTGLADAVGRADSGPYRDVHFSPAQLREIRFAALLHDFGKVGVREEVLLKAKKLPAAMWERISARFDLIHRTLELEWCKARESNHAQGDTLTAQLRELERWRDVVHRANEPSVLPGPIAAELAEISRQTFQRPDGSVANYLSDDELHFLSLPKGTLDDAERAEVESHVTKTFLFLSNIPWTKDLGNMVNYAYSHHEKLNGSGYPRGLSGEEISLAARMITIADMFDALTAADRPYKPAVSPERALEVLQSEADAGRLDADLVRVMAEHQPFRNLLETEWRDMLAGSSAPPPLFS
jgi:HD-GYP domain-containing protein (c-di-GMP phosphodiesterase class II)